jgi:hypothetical protein
LFHKGKGPQPSAKKIDGVGRLLTFKSNLGFPFKKNMIIPTGVIADDRNKINTRFILAFEIKN